jgi:hypothetical protein
MHNTYSSKWFLPLGGAVIKKRAPLRKLSELAEEFGVLTGQLVSAMRRSPISVPEKHLETGGFLWYNPAEMRKWWAEVGGKDFAVSDRAEINIKYNLKRRVANQSSMTVAA